MMYLFFQTWIWIIGAFVLGLLVGWWLCGRCRSSGSSESKATVADSVEQTSSEASESEATSEQALASNVVSDVDDIQVEEAWKPAGFSEKPGDADDLKRIKGVGPVIEKTLNGLGIYQFKQIAEFTSDNITWVDKYISFPGRIDREEWVSQAKDLAQGTDTEFSKRVDKGDLKY